MSEGPSALRLAVRRMARFPLDFARGDPEPVEGSVLEQQDVGDGQLPGVRECEEGGGGT
jgi:hypothetical protein